MPESFVTKVIAFGRVTIPEPIRDLLSIQEGTCVRCTVEKCEGV